MLYSVSQKTSHLWLAITLTHVHGFWYFPTHCYLLSKQSKDALLCRPESNLCFCTTWQKGETQKLHFSLKCCISALPEFNQLLDIFNLFDLRLTLTLLYDSLNLVVNAFSSGLLAAWFRINEVESAAEVGLCCTHNAPVRCLLVFLFRNVMQKH